MAEDAKTLLALYKTMVTVRQFETMAGEHFLAGEIPGFIHLSIGQEGSSVGVCSCLRPDDYVATMSTLYFPFYTRAEFRVPDNWWESEDYYNLPLDVYYDLIKKAVTGGYTVAIGGDVSEPGYQGFEDAAMVPAFDIPQSHINQESREFRFYNRTTEDDHGVHIVGYAKVGGRDWYLIKDSARSSRWGKYKGRYFYRDDYIRLKMLTAMFHKDIIKDHLWRFEENERQKLREVVSETN